MCARLLAPACAVLLVAEAAFGLSSFQGLGLLPGADSTRPTAMSADGSVVVGVSSAVTTPTTPGFSTAFSWTASTGIVDTGGDPLATVVSGDGMVVAGVDYQPTSLEAFRRTPVSGFQPLGILAGNSESQATGLSHDGGVVVGGGAFFEGASEAFRWTEAGGLAGLGYVGGDTWSFAEGVSGDGSVVVGTSAIAHATSFRTSAEAFRWTAAAGMVGLGFLSGDDESAAAAVSADGGTVVGGSSGRAVGWGEAFRWTEVGGIEGLGFLTGTDSSGANGVSADGSVVVGYSSFYDPQGIVPELRLAFLWDGTNGMRSLQAVLEGNGVDLTGWTLEAATAVSADGRTVVGLGTDPSGFEQAWIAFVPEPGAGALVLAGLVAIAVRRTRNRTT